MQEPAPGVRLQHRKSKTFVSEVVDQTHVIMMQTNDGGAQVSITFPVTAWTFRRKCSRLATILANSSSP